MLGQGQWLPQGANSVSVWSALFDKELTDSENNLKGPYRCKGWFVIQRTCREKGLVCEGLQFRRNSQIIRKTLKPIEQDPHKTP